MRGLYPADPALWNLIPEKCKRYIARNNDNANTLFTKEKIMVGYASDEPPLLSSDERWYVADAGWEKFVEYWCAWWLTLPVEAPSLKDGVITLHYHYSKGINNRTDSGHSNRSNQKTKQETSLNKLI